MTVALRLLCCRSLSASICSGGTLVDTAAGRASTGSCQPPSNPCLPSCAIPGLSRSHSGMEALSLQSRSHLTPDAMPQCFGSSMDLGEEDRSYDEPGGTETCRSHADAGMHLNSIPRGMRHG